jgi:NTP pyrophosphatase (non-canonical NTP hydrolase)
MNANNREPGEVAKLSIQCVQDSMRWFGDTVSHEGHYLVHHSLALAGEVGEFCNIVKKIDRGSLDYDSAEVKYDLAMELADVFIYTLNLAGVLKIDLAQAYKAKRVENEKRFMEQRRKREASHGEPA